MTWRYAFEADELGPELAFIPLDVRRRLDLAGLHLSLAAWTAMTPAQRLAICDAEDTFARVVTESASAVGQPARVTSPTLDAPWRAPEALVRVRDRATTLGASIDAARWGSLDDGARYALFRLAAPEKSADKLRAALSELGLSS